MATLRPPGRPPVFLENTSLLAKDLVCIPPQYEDCIESVLIPHGMVVDRVQRLAQDIREDYGESTPHLLCILKVCRLLFDEDEAWIKNEVIRVPVSFGVSALQGSHEFFTDLTVALRTIHLFSKSKHVPYTFDFARLKSYDGMESSGQGETKIGTQSPKFQKK